MKQNHMYVLKILSTLLVASKLLDQFRCNWGCDIIRYTCLSWLNALLEKVRKEHLCFICVCVF